MILDPTGMLSTPVVALQRLVGMSPTFQALCGEGSDYGDALEHVHYEEVDDSVNEDQSGQGEAIENNPRPRAIISLPTGFGLRMMGPGQWKDSGALDLAFELDIPREFRFTEIKNYKQEYLYFSNKLGAILDDMKDIAGTTDDDDEPVLNATGFSFLMTPMPCHLLENGYFWGCVLRVTYP